MNCWRAKQPFQCLQKYLNSSTTVVGASSYWAEALLLQQYDTEVLRNKTAYFLSWFFSMASVLVMRANPEQHHHHLQAWREGTQKDTAMC